MSRKRFIRNMAGIILGAVFGSAMFLNGVSHYFLMQDISAYRPWFRRIDSEMIWAAIGTLLGIFLAVSFIRDFIRFRKERHMLSVISGRNQIPVEELAKELNTGRKNVCRQLKRMLKKGRIKGMKLDEQKGLLLGEAVMFSYAEAWKEWNIKQQKCLEKGITLDVQEAFLEARKQLEMMTELAGKAEDRTLRERLTEVLQICREQFETIEDQADRIAELERVRNEYLPKLEEMIRQYLQLERLKGNGEEIKERDAFFKVLEQVSKLLTCRA